MSKSKITSSKYVPLIGLHETKGIIKIKDTICFRKPMSLPATRKIMSRYRKAIGMVSAHNIYRKPNTPFCSAWCHCFKDPKPYFGKKPSILLSESDFVDPLSIPILPRAKEFKWDFYYFTVGGRLGVEYKGYNLFLKSLPVLCGKHKLKGIVVTYAKPKRKGKRITPKYKKYLKLYHKKMLPSRIAHIMSHSRFGFFPNTQDCSPLMLSESIVRDCPVLINENILGGWKYGQGGMGLLFNLKNLDKRVHMIMNGDFSPREEYMKHYGYKNTAERMAVFCKQYIQSFKRLKMLAFYRTGKMMKQYGC